MSHVDIWGRNIPGSGNGKCKGPAAGASLACSGTGRRLVRLEWNEKESRGEAVRSSSGQTVRAWRPV